MTVTPQAPVAELGILKIANTITSGEGICSCPCRGLWPLIIYPAVPEHSFPPDDQNDGMDVNMWGGEAARVRQD